jgi:hypothetical protein
LCERSTGIHYLRAINTLGKAAERGRQLLGIVTKNYRTTLVKIAMEHA